MDTTRVEMRHLAMLVAVADAPSMAHAAALLGLTQSALSHRLREAERRLDAALFRREGRRLVLTPAGERLLLTARRLVTDLARAESDVRQIAASGVRAVVRLAQAEYAAMPWYAPFYAHARERLPDLQLEVAADAAERSLELLAEGAIDVALVAGEVEWPSIRRRPLYQDSLVAVVAPGHPWERLEAVRPDDLARERMLSYGFVVQPGFENRRFMRASGRYPRSLVKVGRPEALMELVAAGQGIGILSAWAVAALVEAGRLVAKPLALPDQPPGLSLAWYAATRESDAADAPGPRLAAVLAEWCAAGEGLRTRPAASAAARRAASPRPGGGPASRRRDAAG